MNRERNGYVRSRPWEGRKWQVWNRGLLHRGLESEKLVPVGLEESVGETMVIGCPAGSVYDLLGSRGRVGAGIKIDAFVEVFDENILSSLALLHSFFCISCTPPRKSFVKLRV